MAERKLTRRPSNAMMLAVNAAIDGDRKTVDELVRQHDLDGGEIDARLATRNGKKYSVGQTKRRRKVARPSSGNTSAHVGDGDFGIDGRTSVARLFRLIDQAEQLKARAHQELKRRPPEQIEPVKKAMAEAEELRRQREQLDLKMKEIEEALGWDR